MNETKELESMIARVAAVQTERGLSDSKLVETFTELGSAKTWRDRLVPHSWGELNINRWHVKLARVCTILDGGTPDEDFYKDMPFAVEMHSRLVQLERATNDRRILVCLAPNGTGKSAFARWAVAQRRTSRAVLRIRPTWRNKLGHIARGICTALGETTAATNPAECEDHAIRLLRSQPYTLFLDQAHEGGVALMHLIRCLVDETPSRFVYLAYNTAYRAVSTGSTDALIEAKAFLGRCRKPIFDLYKDGLRKGDAEFYLRTVGGLSDTAANSLATEIVQALNRDTNLRLLDDAIEDAENQRDGTRLADRIKTAVFRLSGLDPKQIKTEE